MEQFYMVTVGIDRSPRTFHGTVDVAENTSAQDLYYLIMDAVYAEMCGSHGIYRPQEHDLRTMAKDVTAVLAYHHEPSYDGSQSQQGFEPC